MHAPRCQCRGSSISRTYIHSAYTHIHDSVSPSITRLERACSSEYRTHPRIDIARLSPISPSRAHHAHDHLDVPLLARLARALDHGGASHSAGRAIDSTLSKHPVALRHLSGCRPPSFVTSFDTHASSGGANQLDSVKHAASTSGACSCGPGGTKCKGENGGGGGTTSTRTHMVSRWSAGRWHGE